MMPVVNHNSMAMQQAYPQQMPAAQAQVNGYVQNPQYQAYYSGGPVTHSQYGYQAANPQPAYMTVQGISPLPSAQTGGGMFTRNLIGSLTVNAFKLHDPVGKLGFWFILQDLSVRTEGIFRLKMNFVDVGNGQGNGLNTGKAPVLATVFSEPFQVYSAKKFPGVIESTPLSKTFASQGIKIPIRKDGPRHLSNQAEYDADD